MADRSEVGMTTAMRVSSVELEAGALGGENDRSLERFGSRGLKDRVARGRGVGEEGGKWWIVVV